jgi:hypothetical protein
MSRRRASRDAVQGGEEASSGPVASIQRPLRNAWAALRRATGDDAYERFHARSMNVAPQCPVHRDRAQFWCESIDRKWDGVRRCC